jgi:hypothetical protein
MHKPITLTALAAVLTFAVGCESSTGPDGTGRVVLQLASGGNATAGLSGASLSSLVDELVITSVEIVARKIRLKQEDGACPADEGEGEGEADPDCPPLWLDPLLLTPPVTEGAVTEFTIDIPEGMYDELKLQIHKPTGSAKDVIFLAGNPDFANISVRVIGTWNGEPFEFTTAITAEVEVELEDPIEVAEGVPVAITLLIDVQSWFAGSGGALLDPTSTSQQVLSQIDQNIRQSFKAFEDDDADGEED